MKKNNIIVILIMFLIISLFGNIYQYQNDNKNNKFVMNNFIDMQDTYNSLVDEIINNFSIEGYTEILTEFNHMLALPLEADDDDLLNRQKMFVYKNPDKDTIVILNISYSKQNNLTNEWSASFDYLPNYFNNTNNQFSNSYHKDYPNTQIACNSFIFNQCNISIIAFSNDNSKNIAGEEVIAFSNNLISYLKNK